MMSTAHFLMKMITWQADYNAIVSAMKEGAAATASTNIQQQHQQAHLGAPHPQPSVQNQRAQEPAVRAQCSNGTEGAGPIDPGAATPMGMAGSRIDAELKRMDDMNQAVLSASDSSSLLDTNEWVIPDLALIFRPPKSVIENMAVSIRPGQWAKLAPSVPQGHTHTHPITCSRDNVYAPKAILKRKRRVCDFIRYQCVGSSVLPRMAVSLSQHIRKTDVFVTRASQHNPVTPHTYHHLHITSHVFQTLEQN
jgi:hypothetical protein